MMSVKNQSFPRWSGPLIGVAAGALCGLRAGPRADFPIAYAVGGGAICGLLAGIMLTILDYKPSATQNSSIEPWAHSHESENASTSPSDLVGRFLTLAGLLICWIPFIGFFFNLAARITNRNATDWARRGSSIGLGISIIISLVVMLLTFFAER